MILVDVKVPGKKCTEVEAMPKIIAEMYLLQIVLNTHKQLSCKTARTECFIFF